MLSTQSSMLSNGYELDTMTALTFLKLVINLDELSDFESNRQGELQELELSFAKSCSSRYSISFFIRAWLTQ